jgi:hypothetical protein
MCLALRWGAQLADVRTCLALGTCLSFALQTCVGAPNLAGRALLFFHLGGHLANSPCVVFGHPSCKLALHCVQAPNLGEVVLKNLPPSQNWLLFVLQHVFLPSTPLCGHIRYGSSCVSLRLFVCFVTALHAFCYDCSCVSLRLFMHLGDPLANLPCLSLGLPTLARLLVCFVTTLRALGHPCCELALRCVRAPNLRTRLALDVRTWLALRTCIGAPNLRTCLALRWGTQLADVACVAFGRPSCRRALRCVGAPNLGEAVLKSLPPSQNLFLSILQLVF